MPHCEYANQNDFRRLDQVLVFDKYPLPHVDNLVERLGRAQFISTLDLKKGYCQVAPDAKWKVLAVLGSPVWAAWSTCNVLTIDGHCVTSLSSICCSHDYILTM